MATLGGVTLSRMTTLNVKRDYVGKQERSHDGTMLTDYIASKRSWSVKIEYITATSRNLLMTILESNTSQTLVDLDGNSYTVVIGGKSLKENRIVMSGVALYALEFELYEV